MDALKKLPIPWIAIALLVLVVIVMMFRQRRSGYTPATGKVITMMDLEEFSAFSPVQKANYVNNLMAHMSMLSNAASTNSIMDYKMHLDKVMTESMVPSMEQPAPAPMQKCPPGMMSPTGVQPGCISCPENTMCPNEGMTNPIPCPPGTTSTVGSIMCTQLVVVKPKCPPGTYSPTGIEPGCMSCPANTYCPMKGTTTPMKCPQGTTSPPGSKTALSCVKTVSVMR